MRFLRTPMLVGVAVMLLWSVAVSAAGAATVFDDQSTGANLAVGANVSGTSTGSVSLAVTPGTDVVKCNSTVTGQVVTNPDAAGHAVGNITSLNFTNCSDNTGHTCTVTATGLPWNNTGDGGNGGGVVATSTTSVDLGTGSGGIDISSGCASFTSLCTWQGGTAGPNDGLDHYVSGTWDNSTGEITLNSASVVSNCGFTGDWTATYQMRVEATGGLVGIT